MEDIVRKDGEDELAEVGGRNMTSSSSSQDHHVSSSFMTDLDAVSFRENNVELGLLWIAIERLPTFKRIRTSLLNDGKGEDGDRVIDVTRLAAMESRVFIEKLLTIIEEDNHRLLKKVKERITRVGLELPTVEVRFKNLSVEAECEVVHGKPLLLFERSLFSTVCRLNRSFILLYGEWFEACK